MTSPWASSGLLPSRKRAGHFTNSCREKILVVDKYFITRLSAAALRPAIYLEIYNFKKLGLSENVLLMTCLVKRRREFRLENALIPVGYSSGRKGRGKEA